MIAFTHNLDMHARIGFAAGAQDFRVSTGQGSGHIPGAQKADGAHGFRGAEAFNGFPESIEKNPPCGALCSAANREFPEALSS
jgi:hypothetical protein